MALRYSLGISRAVLIDRAIAATLDSGVRTADIFSEGARKVGTREMGAAIVAELDRLAA
jgi:3-isopropylmalate dehydrogenase